MTTERDSSTEGGTYPLFPQDDDDEESVETTGETVDASSLESSEPSQPPAPAREETPVTEGEFRSTMASVELVSRMLAGFPPDAMTRLIRAAEHAETVGPFMDPTAWTRGHGKLTMLVEHTRALARARATIIDAGIRAGELPEGTR